MDIFKGSNTTYNIIMILVILHYINTIIIYIVNNIIQILIFDSQLILTIINIQLII